MSNDDTVGMTVHQFAISFEGLRDVWLECKELFADLEERFGAGETLIGILSMLRGRAGDATFATIVEFVNTHFIRENPRSASLSYTGPLPGDNTTKAENSNDGNVN